jgi:hypothetical protein
VTQVDNRPQAIEAGTLMQKPIPPRMVEPYLTGRRSVISGFVYRVADSQATTPRELHQLFGLSYEGSDFTPDMPEIYLLRWRAVGAEPYQVPCSPEHGGDWTLRQPFTGTGYGSGEDRQVAEYFTDPMPVPVGAEIHCVGVDTTDFIARYDGQVWLRPEEGPELCATG